MSMGTSIARSEIKRAEQIAWNLRHIHGSERFAWVEHENKLFYAVVSAETSFPLTPVTQLIQYLFDKYIDHSFFILRKRIFTTEKLTDLCQSMVRITAKRATGAIQGQDHGILIENKMEKLVDKEDLLIQSQHRQMHEFNQDKNIHPQTAPKILKNLLEKIPRGEVLHDYNRAIVAILADSEGKIISIAGNNNFKNKTLHAEICLMQDYATKFKKRVPAGSIIYSSLKPCKMCSDAILQYCEKAEVRVYFLEDDPGPLARDISLDRVYKISPL